MPSLTLNRSPAPPVKDAAGKWLPGSAGNPWGRAGRPDGRSESVQRRNIRDRLADIGSLPVGGLCPRCLACFGPDAPDACPRCGSKVIAAPEGATREAFFLEALWNRAIENPDGPAARLLMEYRYGRVPLAIKQSEEPRQPQGPTEVVLRVIEPGPQSDGSPMPMLIEKEPREG